MLKIFIQGDELWDPVTEEIVSIKDVTLELEHSLVSISKWEQHYHVPFLSAKSKTSDETRYYVQCMTLNKNVDQNVYKLLNDSHMNTISAYIEDQMSAVKLSKKQKEGESKKPVTSEKIYSQMIALDIPFECQKWHLNRLMALIQVCDNQNNKTGGKKFNKRDALANRASLNAARRKASGSKG